MRMFFISPFLFCCSYRLFIHLFIFCILHSNIYVYTRKLYFLLSPLLLCLSVFLFVSAGGGFCVYCAAKVRFLPQLRLTFSPANNSQRQGISTNLRFLLDM